MIAGLAVALAIGVSTPAVGGVGIDPGALRLDEPLTAASVPVVVDVEVRNPGEARSTYTMFVQPGGGRLAPEEEWFTFEPAEFDLEPGTARTVRVTLDVTGTPTPGEYSALLTAALATSPDPDAVAQISGAVATEAIFAIAAAGVAGEAVTLGGELPSAADGDGFSVPLWAWLIAALTIGVAVVAIVSSVRDGTTDADDTDHQDREPANA